MREQATHAICAILGRTEIVEISHALERLKQTLSGQERFIKVLPDGTQVIAVMVDECRLTDHFLRDMYVVCHVEKMRVV